MGSMRTRVASAAALVLAALCGPAFAVDTLADASPPPPVANPFSPALGHPLTLLTRDDHATGDGTLTVVDDVGTS